MGGGGVSRYAATPFTVALFLSHSVITRFYPRSPIVKGNNLDRPKNSKICSDDWQL